MKMTILKPSCALAAMALVPGLALASTPAVTPIVVADASVSKTLMQETPNFQYQSDDTFGVTTLTATTGKLTVVALGTPYPLAAVSVSSTDGATSLMGRATLDYSYVIATTDAVSAQRVFDFISTPKVISYTSTTNPVSTSTTYSAPPSVYIDPYFLDKDPVPLANVASVISGTFGLGYTGAGFARGSVDAGSFISSVSGECSPVAGPCGTSFYSIFGALTQDPNNPFNFLGSVHLFVEAGINGVGTAFAFADPVIGLNEDIGLDKANYTILLSPGIANASAPIAGVPEPASWALMIGGLSLAGAALRRRKPGLRFA